MSTTSSVACAKNPVTTADLAGGDVTGIQSLPRGVVPVLCRSTTAAATAPLLACTRRARAATSGAKSEILRSIVVWAGSGIPLVFGGLSGPRPDQNDSATFAIVSEGLTR